MDSKKVIKGIEECDLNGGLIGNCPYKGILALLKEQKNTIIELQNAYNYLQTQFFEAQDKLLKEQEFKPDKCIICEGCGHKLQDNWNCCPWCRWETARGRQVKEK